MVSIILPVYDNEFFTRRTVESVLNQVYRDFELILVDAGGSDSSSRYCEDVSGCDRRVRVLTPAGSGNARAWNLGLDSAKGEYIYFCDCSGELGRWFLAAMVMATEWYESDVVICNYFKKENGEFLSRASEHSQRISLDAAFRKVYLSDEIGKFIWNKMFRRQTIENIRFPEDLDVCQDLYFVTAAFLNARNIYYCCKELYYYTPKEKELLFLTENRISARHTSMYSDVLYRIIKELHLSGKQEEYARCEIFRLAVCAKQEYKSVRERDPAFVFNPKRDITENGKIYFRQQGIPFSQKIRILRALI